MSIADACLVRLTEALPDPLLLTTDSDSKIYRRLHENRTQHLLVGTARRQNRSHPCESESNAPIYYIEPAERPGADTPEMLKCETPWM